MKYHYEFPEILDRASEIFGDIVESVYVEVDSVLYTDIIKKSTSTKNEIISDSSLNSEDILIMGEKIIIHFTNGKNVYFQSSDFGWIYPCKDFNPVSE